MKVNRRQFVSFLATAAGAQAADGFFTVMKRNGRWWLRTPKGEPFFSIGFNHIDAAPLRYAESGDIWNRKYGNNMERWLRQAVRPDLEAWGFNSVGWTQEVVVIHDTIHRHSPSFTYEEYQWLGLPYCHLLPFAEIHQWDAEVKLPDFTSSGFEDWCDYVARSQCGRLAGDSKLIGYFYTDCPVWIHTRPWNAWKGPLFDPARLQSEAGRRELRELAARYYKVTHDAIRRYDRNHLIFGDRYEAGAPVAEPVLQAAAPYVDVFSFQDFGTVERIGNDLRRFAAMTGKPILLADSAGRIDLPDGVRRNDPAKYAATLAALREIPECVGFHLCGAYLRNRARKRGLRGPDESPDEASITGITAANREMAAWVRAHS
ncbi:MAG: hypothetical protein R2762_15715 [Bryobacteraceae bacterium]